MQSAGWIGHHQLSHLHRQGIREPAGVATVHHGIGAGLLQAGVGQAPDRQGQGVDRTIGIQPGVVGHRDDQSKILAAIQWLLRHQPAPVVVFGGWARARSQTISPALVRWETFTLKPRLGLSRVPRYQPIER